MNLKGTKEEQEDGGGHGDLEEVGGGAQDGAHRFASERGQGGKEEAGRPEGQEAQGGG